ncbi:MAG: hypothetical protein ABSE62_03555 [Chthoniobacteraceae bacterium]|jgi:hypothetical protein
MKLFLVFLALLPGLGAFAQTFSSGPGYSNGALDMGGPSATPQPTEKKPASQQPPQGPTIIDSQAMDYDEKTRIAIFTGENYGVFVKDPSFTVNCNKLTAYMRKGAGGGAAGPAMGKPSPGPAKAAAVADAADAASQRASGLQRAIAEGTPDQPVVIVQDKPAANGEQPQHNVGIAQKADYNADTGDIILTGWPRVSQGINTQIATSETTVMIMNKDGHTMKTIGPSRVVIQEQPKQTGTNAESPGESPSSSPQ